MAEEREKYREYIGRELPPGKPYKVTAEAIQKYAQACGEENEEYLSGKIAPPAFSSVYTLKSLGGVISATKGLIKNPLKILHAGQAYEYFEPIRPGDELVSSGKIVDVYEKGKLLWVIVSATTNNQEGKKVSETKITIAVRPGGF
jgi:acyl dehydratase